MKTISIVILVPLALALPACGGSSEVTPPPREPEPVAQPEPVAPPEPEPVAPVAPAAPVCAPRAIDPCPAGGAAPITIADARRRARRLRGQQVTVTGILRQGEVSCTEAECDNTCDASITLGGPAPTDPTLSLTSIAPASPAAAVATTTAVDLFTCSGPAGDPCDAPRPATTPPPCCAIAITAQPATVTGTLTQDGTDIRIEAATVCTSP